MTTPWNAKSWLLCFLASASVGCTSKLDVQATSSPKPAATDVPLDPQEVLTPEAPAGVLRLLRVEAGKLELVVGESTGLKATATLTSGEDLDVTKLVTWQIDASDVVAVEAADAVEATAKGAGAATVAATYQGKTATMEIAVSALSVPEPTLLSVAILPMLTTLNVGDTVQMTATGTYSDGSTRDLTLTMVWSTTDLALATVSPSGLITALATGPVKIQAKAGEMLALEEEVTVESPVTGPAVPTLSFAGASGTTGQVNAALTVTPTSLLANGAAVTSCSSTPALPGWATLNQTTCVISGTPTGVLASTVYSIKATNSVGDSDGAAVTLQVGAGIPTLSFVGATGTTGYPNAPVTVAPTSLNGHGGAITSCSSTPTLPAWASLNQTTCVITGTPVALAAAATYAIVATNSAGSSASSDVTLTIVTPTYLSSPLNVTATEGNGSVGLSWMPAVGSPSTVTYSVYRSTTAGVLGAPIATGLSGTSYTDSTVVNGTTYYYFIVAYNTSDTATSDETAATPSACAASPVNFSTSQSVAVPAGCSYLHVKAWGGAGGGGGRGATTSGAGGAGGFASSTFSVTPAETLNLFVGSGGGTGGLVSVYAGGGGGGGSTAIMRDSPSTLLLEAGGGGGGGGGGYSSTAGHGGAGGGASGVAGGAGAGTGGGGAGTNVAAGAGGSGGVAAAGSSGSGGTGGQGGNSGGGAVGGVAGSGKNSGGAGGLVSWSSGGGGGGGYFGGGGGGAGWAGGGGGGGSSLVHVSGSGSVELAGSGRFPEHMNSGYYAGNAGFVPAHHQDGNAGLIVGIYSATNNAAPAPVSVSVPALGPLTASPPISWVYASSGDNVAVDAFEVAVGTSAGAADVVSWTEAGLRRNFSFQGLSLSNGVTYYASVRTVDVLGNQSAATSSSWTASNSSCSAPAVYATAGTFTLNVPAGCSTATIKAWGAGGGGGGSYQGYQPGGLGGGGGFASTVLKVTPFEELTINVASGGKGGYHNASGGGGGGASAVLRGTLPLVIAAGGGGGIGGQTVGTAMPGGGGGGKFGEVGGSSNRTPGAAGGTQISGGKGGAGEYQSGGDASGGVGGDGGDGNVTMSVLGGTGYANGGKGGGNWFGGGGGGGGYYGGGGGGRGGYDGSAGGGGSSFTVGTEQGLIGATGSVPGASADPSYAGSAGVGGTGGLGINNVPADNKGVDGNPGRVVIVYGP